ncbi:uncharacterized protein KD926_008333 [Aspergillus affinis]|uniref:uncharacterized protein n=1 Tax=Aspergillus affinis TaxID=1070780 RepID=UPI0022FEA5BE|nr:uncharacterized protein KD926_008333 [Aspergillus affinis]KAI9040376.1 hypothetical protein KD926_008333 [Aspergillus affinis]
MMPLGGLLQSNPSRLPAPLSLAFAEVSSFIRPGDVVLYSDGEKQLGPSVHDDIRCLNLHLITLSSRDRPSSDSRLAIIIRAMSLYIQCSFVAYALPPHFARAWRYISTREAGQNKHPRGCSAALGAVVPTE